MHEDSGVTLCITFLWIAVKERFIHYSYKGWTQTSYKVAWNHAKQGSVEACNDLKVLATDI